MSRKDPGQILIKLKKIEVEPKVSFSDGVNNMIKKISDWEKAPLWTPKKIKKATKVWFEYLS